MLKHKIFSFIIAATLITSINNLTWADNEQHIAETDNEVLIKEKEDEREDDNSEKLFYISNVDIEGIKTYDKKYFLENLPIKAGDNASSKKIIEGAKKIFETGYFESVNPEPKQTSYNSISVLYKVKENPIVKSINLKGNTLYTTEELIKASGIKIGEILNKNLLYPDDNGIINLYVKDGYHGARIESINVSDEGDINIKLTEGVVDSVEFTNMKYRNNDEIPLSLKTKPYIFERSQAIKPGQILQKENIEATIENLYRTGIFDRVEPFIEGKEDDLNARIVKFHVEEHQTVSQKIGIGYLAELGIHKSFRLSDSNFLGKGQNASIEYTDTTKGDKDFTINWYEPWLRGTDHVDLFGSVYWEQSVNIAAKSDEVKKAKTIGTSWIISKSLDKLDKDLEISLDTSFRSVTELFTKKKVNDKYKLFQINPRLIYDKRNDKINPTKGIYAEISYKKGKLVNDPRKFDNFEIDLKAYHPTFFGDKNIMVYKAKWGTTGKETPEWKKFSVGGYRTIRGYDFGAFDGYDQFFATIQNRTKINNIIEFIAFFDIGNAWQYEEKDPVTGKKIYRPNRKDAHNFKNLKKSYGIGAGFNTPFGLLKFEYGWPLDPEKKGEKVGNGKFYFNLDYSF